MLVEILSKTRKPIYCYLSAYKKVIRAKYNGRYVYLWFAFIGMKKPLYGCYIALCSYVCYSFFFSLLVVVEFYRWGEACEVLVAVIPLS